MGARKETTARRAAAAAPRGLDAYVLRAMRDWGAPGLALAIVRDGEIVSAKGYGAREIGKKARVDDRTLFAAGSTTKAFTAAAVGMLVDEGKLRWDDPVTKHLPGFALFDPYVTREITVRDLLCHRSGLPRGDYLWYGSGYDRDEILRRVRYLKPSWSFRSRFGYQNIMYLAAGQVVAAVSGKSWDQFVRERIFAPLGFAATTTTTTRLPLVGNVALPHVKIEGEIRAVPYRNLDNIAPAGAINSNAVELAEWVKLHLAGGSRDGKQFLSTAVMKEMYAPHTIVVPEVPELERLTPEIHFRAYGLGWNISDYHGRKIVEHSGGIDGMRALITLVPEERLGIVVLTNRGGVWLPEAIRAWLLNAHLGAPRRDASAGLLKVFEELEQRGEAEQKKREAAQAKDTTPSLPLERYAGTYRHECYGDATIVYEDEKLAARYGQGFLGDLAHWHYDTFQVTWRDRILGKGMATFALGAQGTVERMNLLPLGEFKRVPDGQAEQKPPERPAS